MTPEQETKLARKAMSGLAERLIEKLEMCANFCRGMALDPIVPPRIKESLLRHAQEIDEITEAALTEMGLL